MAGTFHGKLARRHKRDREKRRRKAKLRACLKKKGVTKLPSTSRCDRSTFDPSREAGDQSSRHAADPGSHMTASFMRIVSGVVHALQGALHECVPLRLQPGPVPEQIKWAAAKRGVGHHTVKAAYSSQEYVHVAIMWIERIDRTTDVLLCAVRLPGSR